MGLLNLSRPVEFDGVSRVTAVFYDEQCGHVISVRSGGATGVVVRSTQATIATHTLGDPGAGPVISIKLSPNHATLSVQRSTSTVTFLPVAGAGADSGELEYSQAARAKSSSVLGFVWLSNTELVFVTDCGLEVYSVAQDKRQVKYVRSVTEAVAWYTCHVAGHVLVTSSSQETDTVTVWAVRAGTIVKVTSLALPGRVRDRDLRMLSVYETTLISVAVPSLGEVHLYTLKNDTVTWSHVLTDVDSGGVIDVHTLDNLIIVHSQTLSRSKLYDLQLSSPDPEHAAVSRVRPALPPTSLCGHDGAALAQYSPHWVVFLPNILVDARNGKMWAVNMKLTSAHLPAAPASSLTTAQFLLHRAHGKAPLVQLLRACVRCRAPLASLQQLLGCVVAAYTSHQQHRAAAGPGEATVSCSAAARRTPAASPDTFPPAVVLDQSDIFTSVLNTFDSSEVPDSFLLSVVVEYIHSLAQHSVTPRQFVFELMINLCVRTNRLYQLHQLLQYHVISDSKPVACLLLSLESVYPSSRQMALDMMARLGTATSEITEILLASGDTVTALNYVINNGGGDTASARKFLEAAELTDDKMVFYNVFSFFEDRNTRLRGSPGFTPADQCERFVSKFREMFPGTESAP